MQSDKLFSEQMNIFESHLSGMFRAKLCILPIILKQSVNCLLYTEKETSRVLCHTIKYGCYFYHPLISEIYI